MKILYVITGLKKAGAEKQLYLLIKGLKNKHNIKVISFVDGFYQQKIEELGIEVKTLGTKKLSTLLKLKEEINKFNPDVVHAWMVHANLLCQVVRLLCKKKFRLVCSIRAKEKGMLYWLSRLFDSQVELTITNSKVIRKYLIEKYKYHKEKVRVVYNGIV